MTAERSAGPAHRHHLMYCQASEAIPVTAATPATATVRSTACTYAPGTEVPTRRAPRRWMAERQQPQQSLQLAPDGSDVQEDQPLEVVREQERVHTADRAEGWASITFGAIAPLVSLWVAACEVANELTQVARLI